MAFHNQLWLICCNSISTGKAKSRATGTRDRQVVGAVTGDQRGQVYARPLSTTNRTGAPNCTSKRRSVIVVDAHLSPGIV